MWAISRIFGAHSEDRKVEICSRAAGTPTVGEHYTISVVYLPIEFQAREFDSKVLLAATLAQRGYAVVLGQQWLLYENIAKLPPGAILFKSFNKFHQPAMGAGASKRPSRDHLG